jgi:hypothetical protein
MKNSANWRLTSPRRTNVLSGPTFHSRALSWPPWTHEIAIRLVTRRPLPCMRGILQSDFSYPRINASSLTSAALFMTSERWASQRAYLRNPARLPSRSGASWKSTQSSVSEFSPTWRITVRLRQSCAIITSAGTGTATPTASRLKRSPLFHGSSQSLTRTTR